MGERDGRKEGGRGERGQGERRKRGGRREKKMGERKKGGRGEKGEGEGREVEGEGRKTTLVTPSDLALCQGKCVDAVSFSEETSSPRASHNCQFLQVKITMSK